eukprot:TRINITY_DN279_c1_g1_i1.p1 TRINITY_DN279_c1_g1~~TRINITY_DN279_c1_g1_i1.p1  ORF type:complete len:242 (-),score=72.58 TRINITY_DN279_c1_g1_i1:5-730(-)
MFWEEFAEPESNITKILSRNDFTLEELLDQDEVIQECVGLNEKIVDYFSKPETLKRIFEMIVTQPPEDATKERKLKYPYVCCQILTCGVWSIWKSVFSAGNESDFTLLKFFFEELLQKQPLLNQTLATYFSTVLSTLLDKKTAVLMDFFHKEKDSLSMLVRHTGCCAISDFQIKLLKFTSDEEHRESILKWLNESDYPQLLIDTFLSDEHAELHTNVGEVIEFSFRNFTGPTASTASRTLR